MDRTRINIDEIKVKGSQLVEKVRELIHEGNARRVTIRKDGRVLLEFPLAIGVGGATAAIMFTPVLAAVGALAALVSDVDVEVERIVEESAGDSNETSDESPADPTV